MREYTMPSLLLSKSVLQGLHRSPETLSPAWSKRFRDVSETCFGNNSGKPFGLVRGRHEGKGTSYDIQNTFEHLSIR